MAAMVEAARRGNKEVSQLPLDNGFFKEEKEAKQKSMDKALSVCGKINGALPSSCFKPARRGNCCLKPARTRIPKVKMGGQG